MEKSPSVFRVSLAEPIFSGLATYYWLLELHMFISNLFEDLSSDINISGQRNEEGSTQHGIAKLGESFGIPQ